MLNNTVIEELLKIIRDETSLLKEKQRVEKDIYLRDRELQHIVERAFQQSIQACIDTGARIISRRNFRIPSDYHDIFSVLEEKEVISESLCTKMKELVGFRNALVHEYRWIKNEEVYRHLQESLETIREFVECII